MKAKKKVLKKLRLLLKWQTDNDWRQSLIKVSTKTESLAKKIKGQEGSNEARAKRIYTMMNLYFLAAT